MRVRRVTDMTDIVLIPGLWLNEHTWDRVVPLLEDAGHRVRALTLPGMESQAADRRGVTLADHVAAVVTAVDGAAGPVMLVGHSAGCGLGHAALAARPDRVARAVWVGGFPGESGDRLLGGLPAENGEVPMPDWVEVGEAANVVDFDEAALRRFYAEAIPVPEAVIATPLEFPDDPRRFDVPVTMVCPEYTADDAREWVDGGDLPELAQARAVEYVDLPGGHWPQLTQPAALAQVILDAAS